MSMHLSGCTSFLGRWLKLVPVAVTSCSTTGTAFRQTEAVPSIVERQREP